VGHVTLLTRVQFQIALLTSRWPWLVSFSTPAGHPTDALNPGRADQQQARPETQQPAASSNAAPAASFNQHCALAPDIESILRAQMSKIVLQQNRHDSDLPGQSANGLVSGAKRTSARTVAIYEYTPQPCSGLSKPNATHLPL
jgi:hypothetical protein